MRALLKPGCRDMLILVCHSTHTKPRRSSSPTAIVSPSARGLSPHKLSLGQTDCLYILLTSSYQRKALRVFCLFFQRRRRKLRAPQWPHHWHRKFPWLGFHASIPCLSQGWGLAPSSLPNAFSHVKGLFRPSSRYPIKLLVVRAGTARVSQKCKKCSKKI